MRSLAAPLAAFALAAAAPPPAATACLHPKYDGVQGVTLLFGSAGATPTNSVLVAPASPKNAPAVLWVHWLGEPATTNHTEFMSDAQALAKQGIVSPLVALPWS